MLQDKLNYVGPTKFLKNEANNKLRDSNRVANSRPTVTAKNP